MKMSAQLMIITNINMRLTSRQLMEFICGGVTRVEYSSDAGNGRQIYSVQSSLMLSRHLADIPLAFMIFT